MAKITTKRKKKKKKKLTQGTIIRLVYRLVNAGKRWTATEDEALKMKPRRRLLCGFQLCVLIGTAHWAQTYRQHMCHMLPNNINSVPL